MLADEVDYVVGVDTHRDEHVLAVVVAPTGTVVAQRSVRANARGYAQALRFAQEHADGARVWAVRLLLLARRSAVDVRREALVQLRSVIVTCPDSLREQLRGLPAGRLIQRCSRLRRSPSCTPDELATRLVLRSLARRVEAATAEAAELEREILGHVRALAPQLLAEPGVGPIVAAHLIVAWSHQGRVRSEAAFARLAGVAPDPRLQRQDDPASTQPRRRPPTQPGPAHRHPPPPPTRLADEGLHRATRRRRQNDP